VVAGWRRSQRQGGKHMDATYVIAGALAVWRVTHMLHEQWAAERALQGASGWHGTSLARTLLSFSGLSLVVAMPVALLLAPPGGALWVWWLALSAGAVLLDRVTARPAPRTEARADEAPVTDYPRLDLPDDTGWTPSSRPVPR